MKPKITKTRARTLWLDALNYRGPNMLNHLEQVSRELEALTERKATRGPRRRPAPRKTAP
jgi:hypothetical protein